MQQIYAKYLFLSRAAGAEERNAYAEASAKAQKFYKNTYGQLVTDSLFCPQISQIY